MPEKSFKNIAISGEIGTGTTTLSANLAASLNWRHVNTGEFFRNWHKNEGVKVKDTHQIPADLDKQVDRDFQEQMKNEKNVVFEARLAGYLGKDFKETFKILLTADPKVAIERTARREGESLLQAEEEARVRSAALKRKFKELYGVENYLDEKYFDLVIDTTHLSAQEVLQTVLKSIGKDD